MSDRRLTERLRALPSVDALLRTPEALALRSRLGAERLTALAREVAGELRGELRSRDGAALEPDADEEGASPNDKAGVTSDYEEGAASREGQGAPSGGDFKRDADNFKTEAGDFTREALLAEGARRLARAAERESALGLRRVVNATGVVLHTNLGRAPLSDAARRAVVEEAAGYCTLEYDTETGARGRRGPRAEALLAELTGAEDALVVNNCAAAALLVLASLAREGETVVSRGELVEIGGDFRVPERMAQGAAAVTFSGGKLLGAAQAGLVVGRREVVERLRRHPLYRALRADKLALAALEATLNSYRRGEAAREVPVLRMLAATRGEIE